MLLFTSAAGAKALPALDTNEYYEGLILRMGAGEMAALDELYRCTGPAVYGFAFSILQKPHLAEDVMQDTYVRLYRGSGSYRPQGKPMAWILTIVRNLCLMRLRGERQSLVAANEWQAADPADFTRQSADRMVLEEAMDRLSDTERQVVMLHSVAGMKHREIAGLLGIPLSTALSKYQRALAKLKQYLKEAAR